MTQLVIIGGLVFGEQPLANLSKLNYPYKFIDINRYAPCDLEKVTDEIAAKLSVSSLPAVLIAYSTGGLIALNLAMNKLELFSKLILINTTPCFLDRDNWNGISKGNYQRLCRRLQQLPLDEFIRHFTRLAAYPKLANLERLYSWYSKGCTKDNLQAWLNIMAEVDLRDQLTKINCPVLWLYSDQDHLVPCHNNLAGQLFTQANLSDSTHLEINQNALFDKITSFINE